MGLSAGQLQTLKADIAANANAIPAGFPWSGAFVGQSINSLPNNPDANAAIAGWYNLAAANFWVWRSVLTQAAAGMAVKMTDVGNLTTANSTRLQVSFQIRPNGFNPGNQDDRALFGGLFSVAGAAGTRAALLAAFQRPATNAERLFASGAGTQASGDLGPDGSVTAGSPGTLAFEGQVTGVEVADARNNG